ncbi:MAG: hypothetical protein N2Z74_10185, partial [Syntrophales bacterium]|nr:hypothetical protein [Syntrophales bacterium]
MKVSYYPGCSLHGTAKEYDQSVKAVSRALAKKVGVPVPPGSDGAVENEQDALACLLYTSP